MILNTIQQIAFLLDTELAINIHMIFQIMMCIQCLPGREGPDMAMIAISFAILAAAMWGMYALYRSLKRTAFEAETIAFFLCTISFSITAAYSPDSLLRQTICMLMGLVIFFVLSVLLRDLRATVSLRWPVAVLTCLLLIFNVVLGQRLFGAKNWIDLGFISFQPSEFVKIAFIFTGAATLDRLFARRNLLFTVLFCGFCMGCLALMSDFGTALIFFVALLVIAFLRSGDLGFLALMGTAAAAGGWLVLQFKPYIANRFAAWRHVWDFYNESGGYQQTRTMSAIASGGLFGKGAGGGWLKDIFAANTDMVFAVVCEEQAIVARKGIRLQTDIQPELYAEIDVFPECCELQKLYLDDRVKGRGYGYELIGKVEEEARRLGYKRIYLETHTNLKVAVHTYERARYKQIGRPESVVHSTMDLFYLKELE